MPVGFEVTDTLDIDVPASVRQAYRQRLQDAMDKGFAVSQEEVPEDRGTLRQTAQPPEFESDGSITYRYTQPYADDMEFGTDPFHPEEQPLVEWAERVAGDPGLGYYVANVKIPQEGIDPQPFARPGAEAAARWLRNHGLERYLDDTID